MTPKVKGVKYYNFNVDQQKYRLFIQANTQLLQPDRVARGADYIVGQQLTFSPVWSPPLPVNPQKSPILWHVDGNVMNAQTNIIPGGSRPTSSDVYFLNQDSLKQEVLTNCWWVSRSGSDGYLAAFAEGLTFANGQYVVVSAGGKFTMFRPTATISTVTTNVSIYPANRLIFGVMDEVHQKLISGIYFYPSFTGTQPLDSGYIGWKQVIGSIEGSITDTNGTNHVLVQPGLAPHLDDYNPYWAVLEGDIAFDHPNLQVNLAKADSCSAMSSFAMWLMFTPAGGREVPLAKVDWFWNGEAINDGGLQLIDSDHSPDTSVTDNTEEYPQWKNIVDHTN